MAQIDKFIDALHKFRADHLEVTPGIPVMLGVDGVRRAATTQTVTSEQVDRLLKEIMPTGPNVLTDVAGGQQFTYGAPSGAVNVLVSRANGSVRVLLSPTNVGVVAAALEENGDADDAPVTEEQLDRAKDAKVIIDELFEKMVEAGCSDLHISTGSPPLFRQNGDIVNLGHEEILAADEVHEILLSITPPHKQEEFDRMHDVDYAYEIADLARFRCNLFADRKGMGGVFRVIPAHIRTVEELGLWKEVIDLCSLNKGLVLVTGPTGSGKSTTLAAMIDYINRNRTDHVITVEDPIEFVHPNKRCLINQREIGVHTQSFKVALRAALREDPDVVLVGEMRDLETVAIAIETAETGHLVFGTLHTNTAGSTVDRIIDQFPAEQQSQIRTMLAESLKGVLSQTLVRAKSGGRVAALEFLRVTPAVSNLIREGKTYQVPSVIQTGKSLGMRSLNDSLLELVKSGTVEPEDAYWKAVDKDDLKAAFGRHNIQLSVG
jgi:twitching motility protein PilT